jgi:hypothetical protein
MPKYVIKKDGKYMCHKGHYIEAPFLSDDINDAKVFKSIAGCKTSRFNIVKRNPDYDAWREKAVAMSKHGKLTPEEIKELGPSPKYYSKELKDGYEIEEVTIRPL